MAMASPVESNSSQLSKLSFDSDFSANEYGFYCSPTDFQGGPISQALKSGKAYEPETLKFMRRHIGSGDVISGGAYIGDFFPALCDALDGNAQLHSFEPNPMCFEAAEHTIFLNDLDNIQFHPVAIGERPDKIVLKVERRSGEKTAASGKLIVGMALQDERGIEVDVVTLDSLIPANRKVSMLHLDVEDYEISALKGAVRILNDHRPIILAEARKHRKRIRVNTCLQELVPAANYTYVGTIEHNAIYRAF